MASTEEGASRSRTLMWTAYLSGAFGLAMNTQINFLVPLRAHELGASFDLIGVIVAAGAVAPALLSVILGTLVDRLGAKRSFILGAALAACVSGLFLLVTDYWWLLALQPLIGLARSFGWVASQSYITGLASGAQERAALTGRFGFFTNASQVVAPVLIGGVAQLVGFRLAFVFPVVYAAFFAALGLLLAEDSTLERKAEAKKRGTGTVAAFRLLKLRGVQVALLLTFARLWTGWIFMAFFPVYLVDSGLEPGVVGTVTATRGVVATVMALTVPLWTRFLQQQTVSALSIGCGALALIIAPHAGSLPLAYVVPALIGISAGVSLPLLISIMTTAAPADQRGVALGLRVQVNQVAAAAAPTVVGPLIAALGMVLGFSTGGAISAVLLVGSRLLHGLHQREVARSP